MQALTRRIMIAAWLSALGIMGCGAGEDLEEIDRSDIDEHALEGTAVYQAESATSKSGCSVATNKAGYTGSGFIDFGGNGTWMEWNKINVASAGDYKLTFRYAVAAGSRQCAVLINGANVGNVPFSATGNWTTWKTVSITKTLRAGNNTIRVLANTGSGGPNLDKVDVVRDGVPDGQCALANENGAAALSCPSGQVVGGIAFASYGTPTGSCPRFAQSACHASSSKSKVESLCLNQSSCSVPATNAAFGDPCVGTPKKLAVVYTCKDKTQDLCPGDPNKTEPGQCGCGVPEGTCNGGVVDASTLKGKVMAGYQGWFGTSCDGSGWGWRHWASSTPNAGNITIDMWPDMREYASSELCATGFKYSNGQNARLYSAYNAATVDRHVRWMKDYGIDGVFVQRFVSEAVKKTSVRDKVLKNVQVASEKYGRAFVNMYDISGTNGSTMVSDIKKDWMHLVDDLKVTSSPRYLRHNGRPLLVIWGFGFGDRPGTPSQAAELITWLTQTAPSKYRVTLMGGIDSKWRNHASEWLNVYRRLDVISPWTVGRYADDAGADSHKASYLAPDLADCRARGIEYMPVIFPGFSWYNLKKQTSPLNRIPRRGGKFFWRQAYNAVSAGVDMIYVAMYDEVDEGTAMYKLTERSSQLPTTGTFVPLDADGTALPSDWYLKLMGQATTMLRKQSPLTPTIPISP